MKSSMIIRQFFHTLTGLQGQIALFGAGADDLLLDHGYPHYYEELQSVRRELEALDVYTVVREAIEGSEVLVREGRYVEAERLILEANRQFSRATGTEDALRHIYKAPND